jgi:hypothetical protein
LDVHHSFKHDLPWWSDFLSAVESGASALINHISGVRPQIAAAKQRSTAFKATELYNDNPLAYPLFYRPIIG